MKGRPHTIGARFLCKPVSACRTKTANTGRSRSNTARENALQVIVRELNFPGLTVEDVELKIKTAALGVLLR
jgi:hypothetical protein